jgi:integrase/recombinase XerD
MYDKKIETIQEAYLGRLQERYAHPLDIYQNDDLQEWTELFLQACRSRNLAQGTIEFYSKKLNAFIAFCSYIAITNISQITPETIRHFHIFLEEHNHKPGGIHCYYRSLKTFLKWYERETEQPDWHNPINKVRAPIVPLEPLDPVSVDTIRSMIQTCSLGGITDARDKAILLFLLDTGVRLSEFLALNREDVNMITGAIHIRQCKWRKPRKVYIWDKTRQILKIYLKLRRVLNHAIWSSNW